MKKTAHSQHFVAFKILRWFEVCAVRRSLTFQRFKFCAKNFDKFCSGYQVLMVAAFWCPWQNVRCKKLGINRKLYETCVKQSEFRHKCYLPSKPFLAGFTMDRSLQGEPPINKSMGPSAEICKYLRYNQYNMTITNGNLSENMTNFFKESIQQCSVLKYQ